jgi:integrase
MASVNHLRNKSGTRSFVAQVRVKGFEAVSKTFNERDYRSRREAEKAAGAWGAAKEQELRELRKRADDVRSDIATITFSELVDEYLKDPETKALSTVNERALQLAWFVNKYGTVRALEFPSPVRIRSAREQLLAEFGVGTVNRYLAAARAAWNFARTAGLVPTGLVWPPGLMLTEPKNRERFLDDAELGRALKAAREESELMYAAVMFAIGVGCRQGEQLRVRWHDIDDAGHTVAIAVTKTDTSRRAHLPPAVLAALKPLRSGKVRPMPSRPVFADAEGTPLKAHTLIDAWQRIRERAGLSDVRWHDLRHASASFLIQNGATLAEVAHQLGHKNVATAKRYAHLVPGAKPTGADALNAKLAQ